MEAAITAGEDAVATCHAAVEKAAPMGHAALAEACRELEEAQRAVEQLYARWQELEAKRSGG
jgi:ATP-binding cassette subfamily F protein uup